MVVTDNQIDAISELTTLRAEVERLTKALEQIADDPFSDIDSVRSFAAAALRRKRDETDRRYNVAERLFGDD